MCHSRSSLDYLVLFKVGEGVMLYAIALILLAITVLFVIKKANNVWLYLVVVLVIALIIYGTYFQDPDAIETAKNMMANP